MEIDEPIRALRLRGRGRNKCYWSEEESKAMNDALKELAFEPVWRSSCGFKNGYMIELHRRILIKLPTFSKKVDPHIDSKLKWLKKKFHAIKEMCKQMECSWNNSTKKIQCEKQWYANWVKTHKDAKGLWDMKFPYLEALEAVYGKGRVNKQKAKGLADAVHHLKTEETTEAIDLEGDDEEDVEGSETLTSRMNSTSTLNSRKQKKLALLGRNADAKRAKESTPAIAIESQLEALTKNFGVLIDSFVSIASTMHNKDKREEAREMKANTVVEELRKIGFSDGDLFRAADMMSADYYKLNVFSQLSPDQKRHYVVDMLYPSSYHASRSAR